MQFRYRILFKINVINGSSRVSYLSFSLHATRSSHGFFRKFIFDLDLSLHVLAVYLEFCSHGKLEISRLVMHRPRIYFPNRIFPPCIHLKQYVL